MLRASGLLPTQLSIPIVMGIAAPHLWNNYNLLLV